MTRLLLYNTHYPVMCKFKQLQEALLYKYLYFDIKTVGDLKNAANFCAVFIVC